MDYVWLFDDGDDDDDDDNVDNLIINLSNILISFLLYYDNLSFLVI